MSDINLVYLSKVRSWEAGLKAVREKLPRVVPQAFMQYSYYWYAGYEGKNFSDIK